jgi:leucyl aminopeptidase
MSSLIPGRAQFRGHVLALESVETDLLFIPVLGTDDPLTDCAGIDEAVDGEWRRAVASGEFTGKPYTTVVARVARGYRARYVCFIGVGTRHEADQVRWLRVASACGYIARQRRVDRCAFVVRDGFNVTMVAAAVADGLSAAEFDLARYRTDPAAHLPFPGTVEIVGGPGADAAALGAAVERGRVVGRAVNVARGLAHEPANVLTPAEFASRTAGIAEAAGLDVEVLDQDRMRQLGMGLLLAVAQGSPEAPRMVVMRHDPPEASGAPVIALVGKGVTFDTGGVSIKPAEAMDRMKGDMAGGAAVVAAMWALAMTGAPCRVIGVIPMVENAVGGRAFRPGDVFTGASGKTVEVLDTDAEGRLILADALWYARELGATHLVDIATLTGHCVVGLGRTVAGLMGTPDTWVDHVRAAAGRGGDRVWPLPIYEEALEQLKSDIADLANIGGRPGGAITAAAFLREFTGGLPWAHLDIAGTAWAETREPYQPKGATGAGVRTLIEVATTAGSSSSPARTD